MKVIIDHHDPFFLAHGGLQIQIEQTRAALERAGMQVEFARWWDDSQRADIIHFFGRPNAPYADFAHAKGMKLVVSELLTQTASRSPAQLKAQQFLIGVCRRILPPAFTLKLAWDIYQRADAFVALNAHEGKLMEQLFGADPKKVRVIYNGVERDFFDAPKTARAKWLVCTATITERKRIVELARAAFLAKTPVWIIGKPYGESDPYYVQFRELAKSEPEIIRYEGGISDRARLAQIYRAARGFVLLSDRESLSLSALEAAACECPLLLSDLPWARSVFGEKVRYAPAFGAAERLVEPLSKFYADCPKLNPPFRPPTWDEIAAQVVKLYESLLRDPVSFKSSR
jgi:glycosyltransferase involved in cell wall biosynthesis